MSRCEYGDICGCCPDLKVLMPLTAELIRRRYCVGKFDDCARFLLYRGLGEGDVPTDLLPGQTDRAEMLLGIGGAVRGGLPTFSSAGRSRQSGPLGS